MEGFNEKLFYFYFLNFVEKLAFTNIKKPVLSVLDMLTEEQIIEIREHLEKAQNPLFYFDNDADGLGSFLLLRRIIGRGKGIAVRGYPDLNGQYARRAQELNADYVFVLDCPIISEDFLEAINRLSLPVVWIDHHDLEVEEYHKKFQNLYVYNPAKNEKKSFEPTSYLCYKIADKKEDMWIALAGCISDHYLPEFAEDFAKDYPDYWANNINEPFDAYYGTEIGRIAQAFNSGLKDSTTHVIQMQNYLISCKNPVEVFQENSRSGNFIKKYGEVRKKLDELMEKASKTKRGKMVFFEYAGNMSISSELANELLHAHPEKYIMVVYKKGAIANISIRGKNVKKMLEKVLKNFKDGTGGGHEDAVGARIKVEDLKEFRKLMEEEIK